MGQQLTIVKAEPLRPVPEGEFRSWYARMAKQYGMDDGPESPIYDYRAAFRAGARPDASGHWPSDFKKPGHPNEIVGGFNTRTGERVLGTPRADEAELVRLGWDSQTATRLAKMPEPLSIVKSEPLATTPGEPERTYADTALDVAKGVAKGVGNTVFGLGKVVHDYTPIGRISDAIQPGAFDQRPPELQPTNTPQKVGHALEQIAEFFTPAGVVGKAKKVAEVAKAGALTFVQSGDPLSAGASSALTAVLPGGGVAKKAAGTLQEGAEKTVAQALGPTKEWAKAEAAKIAPQMLQKGVGGSRAAMAERAEQMTIELGGKLTAAYQAASQAGQTVSGPVIQAALQGSRNGLMVTNAAGKQVAIEGTQAVIGKLERLEKFVASLGNDIPIEQAAKIKTTWDHIVSKAGLFGPKAGASATDSAAAWATRESAGAFRKLLNSANPTIADLNKEYAFWKGLKNVLTETEKRTQAQSGGLTAAITSTAGAAAGFGAGDTASDRVQNAILGGVAGRQLVKSLSSPWWRTQVSGPLKHQLADALASGHIGQLQSVISRIAASAPAQLRPVGAQ